MKTRQHSPVMLVFALAFSLFAFIYGLKVLNPFFTDWMKSGDPAQFYYGFNFFNAESWHWILGQIKSLHHPLGTSIVYTDSIPLVSVFLKIFSISTPFQFHGFWILFCFLLQGGFGYFFTFEFTRDRFKSALGAALFLLLPIFLFRNFETTRHYSLLAQVFVLWTISQLHFQKSFRSWVWLLLLALGVHFYFFAFAFFAFACARPWSKKQWGVVLGSTVALGLTYGYFVIPPQNSVGNGFSEFSMNLLGWFNSEGFALSHTDIPLVSSYQREGFQYLGAGVLFLGITLMFQKRLFPRLSRLNRHHYFWTSIAFLALGPLLSFGPYALPDFLTMPLYIAAMTMLIARVEKLPRLKAFAWALVWAVLYIAAGKVLRSSGRGGWYLSYAVVLLLLKQVHVRKLLIAAVVIQLADVAPILWNIRKETQALVTQSPFVQYNIESIDAFLKGHRDLVLVSVSQPQVALLEEQALRNRMNIGPVYLARTNKKAVREESRVNREALMLGQIDSDVVYVTDDAELIPEVISKSGTDWMKLDTLLFVRKRRTP